MSSLRIEFQFFRYEYVEQINPIYLHVVKWPLASRLTRNDWHKKTSLQTIYKNSLKLIKKCQREFQKSVQFSKLPRQGNFQLLRLHKINKIGENCWT